MTKPKTKKNRHKVSLSIETILVLKEVMEDYLKEEVNGKFTKDYKRTILNLNTVIKKHNIEEKKNGHESKT